jgi:ferrous iron transport protein A
LANFQQIARPGTNQPTAGRDKPIDGTNQSKKMKRLSELEPGTIARIHSFEKNDLFLKLMEMGCVPGELVKVEQIAPLGDPISITVAGYNLSLRLDEAENIFMEEGVK